MAATTDIRGSPHPARRAAQDAARRAGRLPVPRRQGQGHLRRQGEVDPQARRQPLLQSGDARARYEMVDAIESVEFLARRHRGRGAARRAELHQAVPAALQHPPARRQVLSVHRDLDGRGLPARLLHARAPPPRPRSTSARTRTPSACAARSTCSRRSSCSAPARAPSRAGARGSPCLDYYIKRCGAPCVGYVDKEEYREAIDGVDRVPLRPLPRDRARPRAADEGRPPTAQRVREAALRAQPPARGALTCSSASASPTSRSARSTSSRSRSHGTDANAQVFQVRDGVLSDRQSFYLDNAAERRPAEVAAGVHAPVLRRRDVDPAAGRSSSRRSRRTRRPRRGARRAPRRRGSRCAPPSAATSAACSSSPSATRELALEQEKLKAERRRQQRVEALDGLQEELGLDTLPLRIECFDISNLMGTHTVASMVVFEGGAPKKSDYRRFTIRGARGRRPRRLRRDGGGARRAGSRSGRPSRTSARTTPSATSRSRRCRTSSSSTAARASSAPACARSRASATRGVAVVVARQAHRGDLHRPAGATPIVLGHDTPELQLLQRVRDEAHRFAITHHRTRRDRAMTASMLDELPGIGPARKRALLNHFGSPEAVLAATREQLEGVPGLPGKTAREHLRPSAPDGRLTPGSPRCPTPTTHLPTWPQGPAARG